MSVALHELLYRRARLPRPVTDAMIRSLNRLRRPGQARRRVANGQTAISDGYWRFDSLPGVEQVIADCQAAFDQWNMDERNPGKQFLRNVIRDREFLAFPELMRFMLGRPLQETIGYLGCVPLLSSARLWWTPPNDTAISSQLFHRDSEDDTQVKFFINISAVRETSGPFTFIGAAESERIMQRLGYVIGRLKDEETDAPTASLIGPPGSGAAVDTSRCLHYGSRGNTEGRLVLMFQFIRFDAPRVDLFKWERPGFDLDGSQRLALGL